MAASGLLHVALLGGLALLAGAGEKSLASLRVRLVTETQAAPVPSLSVKRTPPPSKSLPAVPALPATPRPIRTDVAPTVEVVAAENPWARPGPAPEMGPEIATREVGPPTDASGPLGDRGASPAAGPIGEGEARGAVSRPGAGLADLPPDPALSAASSPVAGKTQGIFLLQTTSGSATGHAGLGAANHGTGTGGGGVGGDGTRQVGQSVGGSGISGEGGGGGRVASRSGGSGSGDGIAGLLRAIRRQIEQARTYPDAARRAGLQGSVEVRFQIGPDGSAQALEIVRSSGHPELDEISMQTIRRAGPYPSVRGRIRVPLSYRLDE